MTTPDVRGLEQLESAVWDDSVSLASALRRCLMLGGYAHHEELRAWALKELDGYAAGGELPSYRKVPAALEIDGTVRRYEGIVQYSGHRISTQQLPQHAQDQGVGENVPILWGVKELEGVVARAETVVRLSPAGAAEYALMMTAQQHRLGNSGSQIMSLHWDVAVPASRASSITSEHA